MQPEFNPNMSAVSTLSRAKFWSDLAKIPRPDYLVKGIFDAGTLNEIYGPTSCGKSFLATDIGLHIALGWQWQGRRVHQCGVLYVNAEGGAAIINRLDAWQRHYDEDLSDAPFAVVIEPTSLLTAEGVDQVLADATAIPDLGMIFIDTAARVMAGSDEGAEAMGTLVQSCDRIRAETGVGVTVVHHTGKDTSRGSRGSTVLPAATDTVIEIKRDTVTKIGTAILEKSRDGETGEILNFTLDVVDIGTDSDGDAVTSCVIAQADRPAKGKSLTDNQATVYAILKDAMPNGLTSSEWNARANEAGIGAKRKATLFDIKRVLKQRGLVHEYNETWYASE